MNQVATYTEKIGSFKDLLTKCKGRMSEVLPAHMTADRMVKVALIAANQNPQILNCTPQSIMQSMMTASSLGLEPNGALGSAYLVPYKTSCQLIVGYRGLIDLARRSGQVKSVFAHCVYEGDQFEVVYGLTPKLEHRPTIKGDRGDIVAAYAVAVMSDDTTQHEVMTIADIELIRARSAAGKSGPWKSDFGEMARKTVVRRLMKYLPLSPEMAKAYELDATAEAGVVDADFEEVQDAAQQEKSAASRIVAQLSESAIVSDDKQTDQTQATDDSDDIPDWPLTQEKTMNP